MLIHSFAGKIILLVFTSIFVVILFLMVFSNYIVTNSVTNQMENDSAVLIGAIK